MLGGGQSIDPTGLVSLSVLAGWRRHQSPQLLQVEIGGVAMLDYLVLPFPDLPGRRWNIPPYLRRNAHDPVY